MKPVRGGGYASSIEHVTHYHTPTGSQCFGSGLFLGLRKIQIQIQIQIPVSFFFFIRLLSSLGNSQRAIHLQCEEIRVTETVLPPPHTLYVRYNNVFADPDAEKIFPIYPLPPKFPMPGKKFYLKSIHIVWGDSEQRKQLPTVST